ncbi:GNAT family N-acetyltransferase [Phreatobacter aquaticus]|uniref:GNAT family N-acetyltransferase n=1 Tax=Phreatobacter aquaticus TaxID=2570229 RepID=A0A4D7QJP0_9HYPH|nr:GNAT family N-acetyltransferase [Phreatobacter aquaticus]QCK87880.1 GNAT family N-acetyltransferase [Phreatobacter aquaticus]
MSAIPDAPVIAFEPFKVAHLDAAVALSRAESWPHRREDWALGLSLSKGVVAMVDGRLVGTAFATPFGPVAMLNMIIVAPEMRGQGLGRLLVERAMARVRADEWRLVATSDGLPLYRKLGFVDGVAIHQHQGLASGGGRPEGIAWLDACEIDQLAALDQAATGMDRAALIGAVAADGRIAAIKENGRLAGFVALRPFGRGQVAGPVIARHPDDARRLLSFALAECDGRFLRVDTQADSGLADWLTDKGLAPVGGGTSMVRGGRVPPDPQWRSFALAAQAFG